MILSEREKHLIGLLIIVVGVYMYYHYLLSPWQGTLNTIQEENHCLCDKILVQQKLLQDETLLAEDKAWDQFKSLLDQVPAAPCIPETIACLEETAQKSGVVLLNVDYRKSPEASTAEKTNTQRGWESEDLEIQVRGDYHSIKSFIKQIEKETYRIYVISNSRLQTPIQALSSMGELTFDPASSSAYDPSNINAEINIKIFYDHISMPGVVDEMKVNGAGSTNPFENQ